MKKINLVTVNDKFRKRIRNYIKHNNLSILRFAEGCGVSSGTIEKMLYKTQNIHKIWTIDKICLYLGYNYYLLSDEVNINDEV